MHAQRFTQRSWLRSFAPALLPAYVCWACPCVPPPPRTDTKAGTSMGFGLQVPAILGSTTVTANMLLMNANKTRVGTFEIGVSG